jgi:hypothetical protein
MDRNAKGLYWTGWLAAVLAAGGALGTYAWCLWGSPAFGLLADQPHHLHFAQEFDRAWRDGDFPPRWAAGANGGRGSVAFVVYPPLFAFLTACWMRLGVSGPEALRLAVFTATVGILVSVLYLARAWLSWRRSLLAGALVLLLPGVTFVALGRGMLPNYAALGWAALLLGAGQRVIEAGQRALLGRRTVFHAALTVVAAAGLALTHTLTTYLLILLLLVISPLLIKALGLRRMAWAGACALAAASLTCWYWLPLMQAGSYTRLNYLVESHLYLDSVIGASAQAAGGELQQDWTFLNDVGRYIVIAQSLLALLLTFALRRSKTTARSKTMEQSTLERSTRMERGPRGAGGQRTAPEDVLFLRALPWVAGFALLAATGFGARLLLELPGAALIQFAWRWQLLIALWCAVALASLPWDKKSLPPAILALLTLALFSPLLAASNIQPGGQRRDLPAVLSRLEFEKLATLDRAAYLGNLLEQRPNEADTRYYQPAPFGRAAIVSGEASIEPRILKTSYREYQVAAATEAIVQIETYHAPGWSASLNMQPIEIRVAGESGLQLITVPPGTHRLQLEYRLPWPWEI